MTVESKQAIYARNCTKTVTTPYGSYKAADMRAAAGQYGVDLAKLPFSMRVLLENLVRNLDGDSVTPDSIKAFASWIENPKAGAEIAYRPARVLMQDFTGVPAVVDLAAMRDAMKELGADPKKINPLSRVDLVIDHSVQVDYFGTDSAFAKNVDLEMQRNRERYELLRSAQKMFDNFRVIPPGTGICHQVNLEYLAETVWREEQGGENYVYPDTVVGTDSHTTMINGLAVLGWGVGGIEAESAMLGQPISMVIPECVGFEMTGELPAGATATDLVLTVTEMLRKKGVVGKFVEFTGEGARKLSLADRATVANMAPEYGATCGFFPIDDETVKYLRFTGRPEEVCALAEAYAKENGFWNDGTDSPVYSDTMTLDLSTVQPSLAGPKRPQDRISLTDTAPAYKKLVAEENDADKPRAEVTGEDFTLGNGDVVIAAVTSCTNTSNPGVMLGAGLLARNALQKGLKVKPWVKTSLAPGSQVVSAYLERAQLQDDLDALGFNVVGFGCTTCIGNSGPLPPAIETAIKDNKLHVTSVLSGNRNFEGRVHALTRANYLASPPLVVAYAIAGNMNIDLTKEPLGEDTDGNPVYLKDIWPSKEELEQVLAEAVTPQMFREKYASVFEGDATWQGIRSSGGDTYGWDGESTYIRKPPFFAGIADNAKNEAGIEGGRILLLLGDSVTTDHISPAGSIAADSPAARYLEEKGVAKKDFNSYGARRGNDEVMTRGAFANIRIRNLMLEKEGGYTNIFPEGEEASVYDAAMRYKERNVPLVVVAGNDYGMGSSRDWAAKGTRLLGVKAVLAQSFERIHRSNLIGMGVLPLVFNGAKPALKGDETVSVRFSGGLSCGAKAQAVFTAPDGGETIAELLCRIDTPDELAYFANGGILHKALRELAA